MDRKRAFLNISIAIISKIIILIFTVVSKSFLVKHLGNEANGLYSLYVSIVGILAVANLGIGTAITFNMYKPIIDNDYDAISALFYLYKKFYYVIFCIILGIGTILTPFVPMLAKDNTGSINIYLTYFIFLFSVSITYLFGHKTSFINAYKDNYVTTLITSLTSIIELALQIMIMIMTRSFVNFLLVRIFSNILNGVITEIVFRNKYKKYINGNKLVTNEIKQNVFKYAKGMMFYRLGSTLMTTFDGIIISSFVGVISLGYYSNYMVIVSSVTTLLSLIFTETTSIVGQLYVKQNKNQYFNHFKKAYVINFIIGTVFYLGFIAISDSLVAMIFGRTQVIERIIVIVMGVNHYIQFLRMSITLFKTASGGFYNDRYRPFVEGIVNIILSIILVNFVGTVGVLIATIASKLLVTYSYEPYILFKISFERSSKKFQTIHYLTPIFFILVVFGYLILPIHSTTNLIFDLLLKGSISVIVSGISLSILYLLFPPFKKIVNELITFSLQEINKRISKNK